MADVGYWMKLQPKLQPTANDDLVRTRYLHLAEGVLVGLRRRPPEDTLRELVDAARGSGVSPYAVAQALVDLAAGRRSLTADDAPPAVAVVRRCWGDLLEQQTLT
jgi:hypothetical protein